MGPADGCAGRVPGHLSRKIVGWIRFRLPMKRVDNQVRARSERKEGKKMGEWSLWRVSGREGGRRRMEGELGRGVARGAGLEQEKWKGKKEERDEGDVYEISRGAEVGTSNDRLPKAILALPRCLFSNPFLPCGLHHAALPHSHPFLIFP